MGTTRLKFKNIVKAEFMDTLVKIILPREPSFQKLTLKMSEMKDMCEMVFIQS